MVLTIPIKAPPPSATTFVILNAVKDHIRTQIVLRVILRFTQNDNTVLFRRVITLSS